MRRFMQHSFSYHLPSWDGTVAPQCGICSDEKEDNRPGEQPLRR